MKRISKAVWSFVLPDAVRPSSGRAWPLLLALWVAAICLLVLDRVLGVVNGGIVTVALLLALAIVMGLYYGGYSNRER
jgi:hypothetical protein